MNNVVHSEKVVSFAGQVKYLDICVGDIVSCEGNQIDFLVLSSFPDDYLPNPGTLVSSLSEAGIDISQLASHKERDWRMSWHCWLSQEIASARVPIKRVVCFEHGDYVNPASVVGNVFRTVEDYLVEDSTRRAGLVRIPLLSTGDQGHNPHEMMKAILRQGYLHLRSGAAIDRIQFFLRAEREDLHGLLVAAGIELQNSRAEFSRVEQESSYDYFISYRQIDSSIRQVLVQSIRERQPDARIFVDVERLRPGSYWKAELLNAMAASKKAVCLATDTYPESPECMDEFHMAVNLNASRQGFIVPLLKLDKKSVSELPISMTRVHWEWLGEPPRLPEWV